MQNMHMICRKTQNSQNKNHLLNFYLNSIFLNVKISIFINIRSTLSRNRFHDVNIQIHLFFIQFLGKRLII